MPQDKRLIVTKAVLHKLRRVCGSDQAAGEEGIFIEFVLPSIILAQCVDLTGGHIFHLPHRTYLSNGRMTCLIVPRVISTDCLKINKRHGYYDAVVTAEAICKRDDPEASRRAAQVAKTFSHFVVDARIVSKLPSVLLTATAAGRDVRGASPSERTAMAAKCITPLHGLDERQTLTFRLSQGSTGGIVRALSQGQLVFRIGHGGMTAGDVCENAKSFIFAMKKDYPAAWKYVHEFKITSSKTESIRFMEVQIQK